MLGLLFAASPPVLANMENPKTGISNFEGKTDVTIVLIGADNHIESAITAALTKARIAENITIVSGVDESDVFSDEAVQLIDNSQFRELIAALGSNYNLPFHPRPQFEGKRAASYSKPPDVKAFHGINVDTYARAGV